MSIIIHWSNHWMCYEAEIHLECTDGIFNQQTLHNHRNSFSILLINNTVHFAFPVKNSTPPSKMIRQLEKMYNKAVSGESDKYELWNKAETLKMKKSEYIWFQYGIYVCFRICKVLSGFEGLEWVSIGVSSDPAISNWIS